jgi:hypothetical protein
MRTLPALVLACAATAGAMDISDLRVGLGGYGVGDASWTEGYSAGPWSATGSGNDSGTGWDGNAFGAFSIMYTGGRLPRGGGLIWAAGIESTFESHTSTVLGFTDQTVNTGTFAGCGRIGFGLPVGPYAHLEFMPELHLGWMDAYVYDTDGVTLERRTAVGGYAALGLHVGGYVTIQRHLVLGASGGFRRAAGHFSATFDSTGGRDEGALHYTQWGGQFEIGFRF